MSEDKVETPKNNDKTPAKTDFASLMSQVTGELRKGKLESVKAKLKAIAIKRDEAETVIRGLDLEAKKLVDDFNSGVA